MGTTVYGGAEMSKGRPDEISLHRDKRDFLTGLMTEALEVDDHLDSREIVAYVAGRLDEIARVCAESHLECYEMCFREVHHAP